MDASIIIVTRDRADDLAQTLDAMNRLVLPDGCAAELLVVDNGSSDHTREVVEGCRLGNGIPTHWVCEEKPGLSNGRNRALAESEGAIILFTDDDVRPPADWISRMCQPILDGESEAVAGGVAIAPHLMRPWMKPRHKAWLASSEWLERGAPKSMVGANMVFARKVLEKVPGFDPELGAGALGCGEEGLFASQILEAGYRIADRIDVEIEHHFQESRLERGSWLAAAEKMGNSHAYLGHHWEHWGCRFGAVRSLLAKRKVTAWRNRHPGRMGDEGCDEEEMVLLFHAALVTKHWRESRRKRLYERHGLVKPGA